MIARVLLPLPIMHGFDFFVPEGLQADVHRGVRVAVRFRKARQEGVVLELPEKSEHEGDLEEVTDVVPGPRFSADGLAFCLRAAEVYLAPQGLFLNRILPRQASSRRARWFELAKDMSSSLSELESLSRKAPRQADIVRYLLSSSERRSERELRKALGDVRGSLGKLLAKGLIAESTEPSVLFGSAVGAEEQRADGWLDRIAGRGEALLLGRDRWGDYGKLVRRVVSEGRQTLVLAPDVLSAEHLCHFMKEQLGERVHVYHSGVSEGERGRIWEGSRLGRVEVVVGARSALFIPFHDLGAVIVDEEQDRGYKQDDMLPYYHAVTLATEKAKCGLAVLGSSAPSLEAFAKTESGQRELVRSDKPSDYCQIRIADASDSQGLLNARVISGIRRVLDAGKRAVLGVNRRGYFRGTVCKGCGRPLVCPECGVNLSYQVGSSQLVCRQCGKAYTRMACPHCGSRALRFVGVGSERVEEELKSLFPDAGICRIDGETVRRLSRTGELVGVLNGEADILVGTPVIAKGPSLPGVEFGVAIGLEALLAFPDFRAAERTYQYVTGLAGRLSGGELIVQTHYPDHFALRSAQERDYEGFYRQEMAEREALFYPPFSHLAYLLICSRGEVGRAKKRKNILASLRGFSVDAIGPTDHPTRRECEVLMLKGKDASDVREACLAVKARESNVEIDLDPMRI